jgi:signal transduction histidine kinase
MQDQLFIIREGIRSMIDELRNICGTLRPPTIDSLGINAAIQSFAQDWSKRSGIKINLDLDPEIGRITEAIELSIYRIVQESLSNVYRHSSASTAKISIKRVSPRAIMLSVEDNGTGIDTNFDLTSYSQEGHYGMVGIQERVALLGGRLRVQNQPEGGLLIQAEIPHPRT